MKHEIDWEAIIAIGMFLTALVVTLIVFGVVEARRPRITSGASVPEIVCDELCGSANTGIYQNAATPPWPIHLAWNGKDIAKCKEKPEHGNWFMCQIHGYPWAEVAK